MSINKVEQLISYHIKTRQNLQCFVRYKTQSHRFPAPQMERCCLCNFDIAFSGTYSKQITAYLIAFMKIFRR
jgi:hypothetical protein